MRSLWRTLAPATMFAVAALTVLQLALPISAVSPVLSVGGPMAPAHAVPVVASPGFSIARTAPTASVPAAPSSHPGILTQSWYNITPGLIGAQRVYGFTALPPALTGAAVSADAFSSGGPYTVMFGGQLSNGFNSNQTWVFAHPFYALDPGSWINVTNASNAPPALAWATMSFDPWIPGMVLFGGAYQNGSLSSETWVLNDSTFTWTNISTTACALYCPAARYLASSVFAADSVDNYTVLFGGCGDLSCITTYNDTYALVPFFSFWVWAPVGTGVGPSLRWGAMMAYGGSGAGNSTWLFGGCESFHTCSLNDTWNFYNGTWFNATSFLAIFGSPEPSGRTGGSMTYDAWDSELVLTGGFNDSQPAIQDTWVFVCPFFCVWTNISATTLGVQTVWGGMSSDTPFGDPLIFGGQTSYGGAFSNTTWVFQPSTGFAGSISNSAPEVGQLVDFNSTLFGGSLVDFGYSIWFWQPSGGPVTMITGNQTRSFSPAGIWYANVTVLDVFDVGYMFSWTLTVGTPSLNASASVAATDVGVPVHFTSTVSGQYTAPLNWSWWFGDGPNVTAENVTHTFASAGSYSPMVTLVDNYTTVNRTVLVTVNPDPTATASVSPTGTAVAGQNLTFASHVHNGTAPFAYSWNFTDGSASSSSAAPVHAFAAQGDYTVALKVTDAVGYVSWANVTVHVQAPLVATATSNLSTAATGASISFSAAATGGSGTYTYAWQFGDASSATTATATHAFSAKGSYTAHLWVNDSAGHSATATVTVAITAAPGSGNGGTSSGSSSSIPSWVWIVLVIVVLAAIVGAVLMMRGRKKPPAPEQPPTGSPGGAPPPGATGGAPPPGATGSPPTPPA